MRFVRGFLALLPMALVVGCSAVVEPDPGFVQDEWSKGIRRLGRSLFSVYPPSEDYQVGDVFATGGPCNAPSPEEYRKKAVSIRIGNVDPLAGLDATYRRRLQFPLSPFKQDGTIDRTIDPPRPAKGDRRGSGLSPLPIVAFPEFTVASGTLDKFGGTFATGAFGAIFGGSFKSDTFLEVKIKEGSTYGVDAFGADAALASFCSTGKCAPETLRQLLLRLTSSEGMTDVCNMDVVYVSRVFMTRQMTFTYTFSSAQTFEAAISAASVGAAAKTAEARQGALKTILGAKLVEDQATDKAGTSAETLRDKIAYDLATDLEADLKSLAEAGGDSAFFLHASRSSRSVTLVETFRHPLVFAYSGLRNQGVWGARRAQVRSAGSTRHHSAPAPVLAEPAQPHPAPGTFPGDLNLMRVVPMNGAAF